MPAEYSNQAPGTGAKARTTRASSGAGLVQSRRVSSFSILAASPTERSLSLLLEKEFDIRVLVLSGGADPDKFIKEHGADAYRKQLTEAPPYLDYLIARARQMDRTTAAGKIAALNFLMPHLQRVPNRLLRSEWATRVAAELRVDEPVLREALRRAAAERRSEVKPQPELLGSAVRPAERRLMHMLIEAEGFREKLAHELISSALHRGLETERIFELLITKVGEHPDAAKLAEALEQRDRDVLFKVLFEPTAEATWEEAESCLGVLRDRSLKDELTELQKKIEAKTVPADLTRLLARRLELQRMLARQ